MELRTSSGWAALSVGIVALVMLVSCDKHSQTPPTDPRPALATQIELTTAATNLRHVAIPNGSDVWLLAMPYTLEENWSKLNLSVSAADKERLVQANVAIENVLLARITSSGAVTSTTLDSRFAISPSVFVARAGDMLTLQKRDASRSLLITNTKP